MDPNVTIRQRAPIIPDVESQKQIKKIGSLASTKKAFGLYDISRSNGETPVSSVTVTKDMIVPQLSSNVMNCGMTVMKVNLSDEEVTPEFLKPLFQEIHQQLRKGPYSFTKEEAYKMFQHGAKEGIKYFGLDENFLDRIDQRGQSNLMQLKTKDLQMREVLPWTSQFMGAYNAPGNYLKGNHFLEVQQADKVLHKEHAKKLGIKQGDHFITYHFDSPLTMLLSFNYVLRKKIFTYNFFKKNGIYLSKILFHFIQNAPHLNFATKFDHYFRYRPYTEIPLNSLEGQRFIHALHFGNNYGYVARLALGKVVKEALKKTYDKKIKLDLVSDHGHDTFRAEQYEGEDYIIARKGAGRAEAKKPAYISGRHDTPSFLNYMERDNPELINSFDHGFGYVLKNLKVKITPQKNKPKVHIFRAPNAMRDVKDLKEEFIPYNDDERTTEILKFLKETKVTPTTLLRPIANYKILESSFMHDVMRR